MYDIFSNCCFTHSLQVINHKIDIRQNIFEISIVTLLLIVNDRVLVITQYVDLIRIEKYFLNLFTAKCLR